MILKWRILSATNDLDRVSAVALPKLPISLTNTDLKVASDTQFYPGLGTFSPGAASTAPGPVGWEVGSESCGFPISCDECGLSPRTRGPESCRGAVLLNI